MPERFSSQRTARMRRYQPKHELVSIVAYLIGVPKQIFENEYEPPQLQYYTQLDQNRKARIIRNLCILRTDLQRNFSKIYYAFRDGSDIWSMKDWVSIESISQLERDNCRIYQRERSIYSYIGAINLRLSDRLDNIKEIFPPWLKWEYVRSIFLLPANYKYREMKNFLPYQCCVNFHNPYQGNILSSDEKFVTLLYESFEDSFQELQYVRAYDNAAAGFLGDLLRTAAQPILAVDGESLDFFQLTRFWSNFPPELAHYFSDVLLFCRQERAGWASWLSGIIDHVHVISAPEEGPEGWPSILASQLLDRVFQGFFECNLLVMLSDDAACLRTALEIFDNPEMQVVFIGAQGVEDSGRPGGRDVTVYPLDEFLSGSDGEASDFSAVITEQFEQMLAAAVRLNMKELFAQMLKRLPIKPDGPRRQELYAACVDHLEIRIEDNGDLAISAKR